MKFVNFVKYKDLAIGGPIMDDQGTRIGLLFVYEGDSRDEALTFAREDPSLSPAR